MTTLTRSSLYQQLRLAKDNLHDLCKVRLFKDNESDDLTDSILNERNNGIFVAI